MNGPVPPELPHLVRCRQYFVKRSDRVNPTRFEHDHLIGAAESGRSM